MIYGRAENGSYASSGEISQKLWSDYGLDNGDLRLMACACFVIENPFKAMEHIKERRSHWIERLVEERSEIESVETRAIKRWLALREAKEISDFTVESVVINQKIKIYKKRVKKECGKKFFCKLKVDYIV